jgi:hypothetical protein
VDDLVKPLIVGSRLKAILDPVIGTDVLGLEFDQRDLALGRGQRSPKW